MSSFKDTLLFMISCGGKTTSAVTGLARTNCFSGRIGFGVAAVFVCTTVLIAIAGGAILASTGCATILTEMGFLLGIIAFATFVGAAALNLWAVEVFLMFIIGAVVEVPHSLHFSLYSARRRPHFRQNGMFISTFEGQLVLLPLNFN